MATRTFGTTTTTALTAVAYSKVLLPADLATINAGIKDDKINIAGSHPILSGCGINTMGQLFIPNRGILQILDGDYVAIDNNGWPILISANSIGFGSTLWAHS